MSADEDNKTADEIKLYRERLMQDLGLDKLPEDQQKEFVEKIDKLVNDRIINLILICLPDENLEEFGRLSEEEDVDKLVQFVSSKIPSFQDKVLGELMDIREELIGGIRQMHQDKS